MTTEIRLGREEILRVDFLRDRILIKEDNKAMDFSKTGKNINSSKPLPEPKDNQSRDYLSFILKDVKFKGEIYTKKNIEIQTQIEANITTLNSVIIEQNGLVKGNIVASSIICSGGVKGNIQASNSIKINSSGKVVGNIQSENLTIEKGGSIEGKCKVTKTKTL